MAAEGFVGRWSRLKRQAGPPAQPRKQDETQQEPPPSLAVRCTETSTATAGTDAPVHAAIGSSDLPAVQSSVKGTGAGRGVGGADQPCRPRALPDIESLGADSDLSMFMDADVDPHLRVKALKKLFADPHFNRMDGLDVYVGDYSKPDPMPLAFIRRLDQSRILGLSDEPAPDHAVPGEAAATEDGTAATAYGAPDGTAASHGPAAAGEAVASATPGGAPQAAQAPHAPWAASPLEEAGTSKAAPAAGDAGAAPDRNPTV